MQDYLDPGRTYSNRSAIKIHGDDNLTIGDLESEKANIMFKAYANNTLVKSNVESINIYYLNGAH